jgi:hypothetical protein
MNEPSIIENVLSFFKKPKEEASQSEEPIPRKEVAITVINWAFTLKQVSLALAVAPVIVIGLELALGFIGVAIGLIVVFFFAVINYKRAEASINYLQNKYSI